jgi:hypothetical protein
MNKSMPFFNKVLAVLVIFGLVMVMYLLWARPYQQRWGATDEEINRPMPGDELNLNPTFLATRGITIDGTPEEIWPWLVQMGYGRAGFYGYDLLENIGSKYGIRSADRILPEFQHFAVGDEVPLSAAGGLIFYAIEPNQYLVWSGGKGWGGFTWALYPIDEHHTRLVSRARFSHNLASPSQLAFDLFTEFSDHLAVRKILQGVKGQVEGPREPFAIQNVEFAVYLIALLIFVAALGFNLLRPFTWQRCLATLIAGLAWLITWYAPVPIWGGVLLELLVLGNMYNSFRQGQKSCL